MRSGETEPFSMKRPADLYHFFPQNPGIYNLGVAATAFVLWGTVGVNRRRGASWSDSLPQGYAPAGYGSVLFIFVGGGDALWHTFFGIEHNLDAVFSPTHLLGMV